MRNHHDRGGEPAGPVDREEHELPTLVTRDSMSRVAQARRPG